MSVENFTEQETTKEREVKAEPKLALGKVATEQEVGFDDGETIVRGDD